jgi:subtilisin-like proprotein convertase family protein
MNRTPIVLHNKYGGGTNNIKRTFDTVNTPELSNILGKNPQGKWQLEVQDTAKADTGKIRKFTVQLGF